MKKGLLRVLAVMVCILTLTMAQVVSVSAAEDDIVLNDAGSPLIRVIDPGDGEGYTYMGYVYCGEGIGSEYAYMQLSYKGDASAFSELRIEILDGSDNKIGVFWFSENDEGSFRTADGSLLPAPTDEVQTVVVDFAASGIDVSNGIHAMHIHDTKGTGAVTFTDARLMTSDGSAAETEAAGSAADDSADSAAAGSADTTADSTADDTADTTVIAESTSPKTGESSSLVLPWVIVGCGAAFVGGCVALKAVTDRK